MGAKHNINDSGKEKTQQTIDLNGVPGRIRTCDLPLRRRLLYPTELQGRKLCL